MSGVKRTMDDKDPDYEDISVVRQNKRHKAIESSARDAAISKIESIVKEQFALELKNKEHEIEIIDQRLTEARRMMDKLRAYIVANYYASAGVSKVQEGTSSCDPTILNHPSIKKFLESPSRASSPANHRSDTPSANNSETDSVCTHSELDKDSQVLSKAMHKGAPSADTKLGKDSVTLENVNNKQIGFAGSEDTSRRFVKKTIVVGNVSKYIPPDKREENDQSTHKWMIYVRGSRKEPSIDHFVKKVWFFLHPSYKPNDLVEVSEPPFHLTRRGWGEFPVRVQIHFKDSQNKRIDIIHNLKLDRTYTGLQTLGAETVVEVELLRHSFSEEYLYSQSYNESSQSEGSVPGPATIKNSSPQKGSHELTEKGYGASDATFYTQISSLERTPTKMTQRFTIGAHGSTAFQPITASCKIVPQGQATNLAESPGKSFQPITMSCKIVSGSPTSKQSNVAQAGTRSPLPKIHGSSFITQNIKQEESLFAAMPPLCPIGSHSKAQSPKPVAGGLGAFTKVIIKQEPIESSQQQQETPSTSQPSLQQIVTVKGNQMIAVSPHKTINTAEGSKVVSIPVGSAVQASMKPSVTISGGQILVAKSGSSAAKAVGTKQIVAQGVAKAVVSSGSASVLSQAAQNVSKTQVASAVTAKTGSQGSVMATLQLPSTNLGNLANLPPGTKLYLTTNSKNTSGKGKLLLIPQGAILRAASTANLQSGASTSGGSGTGNAASGLPQHLTYTSYILKQTPQGTFLVGQPSAQTSGKQATSNVAAQGSAGASAQGQPALKVSSGQKSTIVAQANSSTPGLVKISENVLKSLPVTSQTQKPGTTLLRVAGGVITATTTSLPSVSANGPAQQGTEGSSASVPAATSSSKTQPSAAQSTSQVKIVGSSKSGTLPVPVLSSRATLSPVPGTAVLSVKSDPDSSNTLSHPGSAAVKLEENMELETSSVKTEHLQNFKQLLTATVKKIPLIGEREEDGSNPFSAGSLEQYYSWNIGKRRASEWQRAVSMKKMLREIIEKQAKFNNLTPLKTREIVHWCRIHGYTPPDPENASDERESFEDVLTRIDNEAALPSSYSSFNALCRKVEELEKILKKEKEVEDDVDILSIEVEHKPQIKRENEEEDEVKFYLTPSLSCEFIRDAAQEIGVSLQPVEVQKNVYASPVEEMILKATEQFVNDLLRDALAVGYQMNSRRRAPREISVANIHQAICNIPLFDFLTNRHLGALHVDDALPLK